MIETLGLTTTLLCQLALIVLLSVICLIELINSPQMSLGNMLGKLTITTLWIAIIASFFIALPELVNTMLYWLAFLLAIIHTIECIAFHRQIKQHHSKLLTGYFMVLLFGGLHASQWKQSSE